MKGKGNHFALTNKFLQIKFNRPLWNSQFLTAIIPIYNRSLWKTEASKFPLGGKILYSYCVSLRASSPIWASEASLARTCERAAKPRGAEDRSVLARLAKIGELSRRLAVSWSAELVFSFLPDFKRRQPVWTRPRSRWDNTHLARLLRWYLQLLYIWWTGLCHHFM